MIERNIKNVVLKRAEKYPVLAITGPRQSGKTTLCRAAFPHKPYVSLEALDMRSYAQHDPRGFLAEYAKGAIIDEVQHVPDLLSYLQEEVDARPQAGRFVLTGSQHFALAQQISQSLAGRVAVLSLLPPSLDELRRFGQAFDQLWSVVCDGAYPRIFDQNIPAHQWLSDYVSTYIQRDVRQVLRVTDLEAFTTFVRLCAGRCAQEIKLSALASDAGIATNTARAWLSVLEQSYLVFRLPSWQSNSRKQIIKAAKLHFFDTGLVCHLLGIHDAGQLRHHPLRGPIFESWVASEIRKNLSHRGVQAPMFHYRRTRGTEVDCLVQSPLALSLVEVKSGATVTPHFFKSLRQMDRQLNKEPGSSPRRAFLIFGGDSSQQRSGIRVLSWTDLHDVAW